MNFSKDGTPVNLYYSTSDTLNQLNWRHLRVPILQSIEIDTNYDGRPDRIEFNVQLPLSAVENIYSFKALMFHDVTVNQKARYKFDGISLLQKDVAIALGYVAVDGDVTLKQTWPFIAKGGYVTFVMGWHLLASEIV